MRATHRYDVAGRCNTGAWSHSIKAGAIGRSGTPRFSSIAERFLRQYRPRRIAYSRVKQCHHLCQLERGHSILAPIYAQLSEEELVRIADALWRRVFRSFEPIVLGFRFPMSKG